MGPPTIAKLSNITPISICFFSIVDEVSYSNKLQASLGGGGRIVPLMPGFAEDDSHWPPYKLGPRPIISCYKAYNNYTCHNPYVVIEVIDI